MQKSRWRLSGGNLRNEGDGSRQRRPSVTFNFSSLLYLEVIGEKNEPRESSRIFRRLDRPLFALPRETSRRCRRRRRRRQGSRASATRSDNETF